MLPISTDSRELSSPRTLQTARHVLLLLLRGPTCGPSAPRRDADRSSLRVKFRSTWAETVIKNYHQVHKNSSNTPLIYVCIYLMCHSFLKLVVKTLYMLDRKEQFTNSAKVGSYRCGSLVSMLITRSSFVVCRSSSHDCTISHI